MDRTEISRAPEAVITRAIAIAGMGCDNCVRKLERALRAKEGVKEVHVDGIGGLATVTFDPARTNLPELQEVIAKSGYRATAVNAS